MFIMKVVLNSTNVACVLFSAFITVNNCHDAAVTSDYIIWLGPLSLSADVPVDAVGLLWLSMGLHMLIHASQLKEEDPWVPSLQTQVSHKAGLCRLPGKSLQSKLLRTHYNVLEENQRNFRSVKGKT